MHQLNKILSLLGYKDVTDYTLWHIRSNVLSYILLINYNRIGVKVYRVRRWVLGIQPPSMVYRELIKNNIALSNYFIYAMKGHKNKGMLIPATRLYSYDVFGDLQYNPNLKPVFAEYKELEIEHNGKKERLIIHAPMVRWGKFIPYQKP